MGVWSDGNGVFRGVEWIDFCQVASGGFMVFVLNHTGPYFKLDI